MTVFSQIVEKTVIYSIMSKNYATLRFSLHSFVFRYF